MNKQNFLLKDLLWLTVVLSLLFGTFLGTRPLMTPDEGRYAEIPREMVESGDYLTPHLNYIKYFEKPALFYWLEAASIKVFGLNEWALRGVVAIMSLAGCLMVYIAGLRLYDRRTGIIGCLMLATSALYFNLARFIITDMPFTAWMTISLLLFILGTQEFSQQKQRYYFWGMYAGAALAVLTKGLIGVVFPGMVIFAWLCVTGEWKQLKNYCLPSGILLFLLIAAPWHILVQLKNPEFFQFYFIDQHFLRYLTDYAGRRQAIWFFPAITLGGFFPWVSFLLALFITSLLNIARNKHSAAAEAPKTSSALWGKIRASQPTIFFTLWAVVLFVFFSLSKSQLLSYALPLMPPLAILLASYFSQHWEKSQLNHVMRIGFTLVALFGLVLSAGALIVLQHKLIQPSFYIYAGIAVLLTGTCTSALLYWRTGVQKALVVLMATSGIFFILGDVAYPTIDTRSLKPLIASLKPLLKLETEVVTYHEYYQDLPVYLARRITVVGYKGELAFGAEHQDTSAWLVSDSTFWQRWHNKPGMFMIMGKEDYALLKQQQLTAACSLSIATNSAEKDRCRAQLQLVAQTTQDVLLTNRL